MAPLIQRRWSLGMLRVTLDEAPEVPTVTCEVVINEGSTPKVSLHRELPLRAFGMDDSLERRRARELRLSVPPELVADVAEWVHGGADARAVLWIHLVKPYSILGGVPWEQMQATIGIPVLRLPDVFPDQLPPQGRLDIAVCAATLEAKGELPLLDVARQIVQAAGSLGDVRVHFFVDEPTAVQLTTHLGSRPTGTAAWIVHHWDPAREADTVTSPRSRRREARAAN